MNFHNYVSQRQKPQIFFDYSDLPIIPVDSNSTVGIYFSFLRCYALFLFYRLQESLLQKAHSELPSRDRKWLVWKGDTHFFSPLLTSVQPPDMMSESLLRGFSFTVSVDLSQVILAEVLCDCSSSQAVVKELRLSASPLEQRKFLAESEPYR